MFGYAIFLTQICLGCWKYIKAWGGISALPLKKFEIWLKTKFMKVCHGVQYIKIIILKIGFVRKKLPKKSHSGKILGGGRTAPPPRPTRVKKQMIYWTPQDIYKTLSYNCFLFSVLSTKELLWYLKLILNLTVNLALKGSKEN